MAASKEEAVRDDFDISKKPGDEILIGRWRVRDSLLRAYSVSGLESKRCALSAHGRDASSDRLGVQFGGS